MFCSRLHTCQQQCHHPLHQIPPILLQPIMTFYLHRIFGLVSLLVLDSQSRAKNFGVDFTCYYLKILFDNLQGHKQTRSQGPRVFLRHTLITKPSEHPSWDIFAHICQKRGQISRYYGFSGWLGSDDYAVSIPINKATL